jgi:beta-lactamase regulating signal transducer with metallopeptidase domain
MTEHLLVSTAVLAVILIATRLVPLTARTRYALLLCGILKFAIPVVHVRSEAVPQPLRVFGATGAATAIAEATTRHIDWLPIAWAVIAVVLFARWVILRTRTVHAALRGAAPASERETRIVRAARMHVGVVRSPMCEAPAVLRVRKPVIVLPAHGCDDLDDDELRAVILHECAHVARRDNLATIVQALATSLLWFHPLLWIASRALTAAREEACDETVADAMHETESYLSALTKICHALAAPPAGASCMASAHLKQRLEHLMSYGSLKKRAWSHAAALVAAVLLIAVSAVAGTTATRKSVQYKLQRTITRQGDQVRFHFMVRDGSGAVVYEPVVLAKPNESLTARSGSNGTEIVIHATGDEHKGTITFDVTRDGQVLQHTVEDYEQSHESWYTGAPISIRVVDADLRDLMKTYGELTGLDVNVAPGVVRGITLDVVNMPWDEALEKIARENDLVITIEGRTINVAAKK